VVKLNLITTYATFSETIPIERPYPVDETLKKVRDTISRYQMINPKDRIVVGVSGGPDSVCLLDILNELRNELGIELIVAHFNHGLRPEEDGEETRFVESMALSLNLPFETKKAGPYMQETGSLEEKARHARYCFFDEVNDKFSARKIATGHTLNDQAETVLMRLLRGSGTSGLAGIPPVRGGRIIRPLINLTRDEVLSYVELRGLKFITDSSNRETHFLRNSIRLEVLPQLMEIQPRVIELLGQTAEIMKRDDEWMEAEAAAWMEKAAEISEDFRVQIPLSGFNQLPEALQFRIVRHALMISSGTLRRISLRHVEDVISLVTGEKPQAQIHLPNGLVVERTYDILIFYVGVKEASSEYSYSLDGPGTFRLETQGYTVSVREIEKKEFSDIPTSPWTAFLNGDRMTYPLEIRNFRPGDRFIPFGMSGHKKLKDLFIERKIPLEDRIRMPILTNNDKPIWVCGIRIDDRYKVTDETKQVIRVQMTGNGRQTTEKPEGGRLTTDGR